MLLLAITHRYSLYDDTVLRTYIENRSGYRDLQFRQFVNTLRIGESNSARPQILNNVVKGHLQGSLYDGRVWTEGTTVKVRKEGGGHYSSDTILVDMPNPTEGQPSIAAGLKGFTKCECIGVVTCTNSDCNHLKHYGKQSEIYERRDKKLICKGQDNMGCGFPMTTTGPCGTVTKYRLNLVYGSDNYKRKTAIVYHGQHSDACEEHCKQKCEEQIKQEALGDTNTLTSRVAAGVDQLCMSVVEVAKGSYKTAKEHGDKGKLLLRNIGTKQMKGSSHKKQFSSMKVEEVAHNLRTSTGLIIVPYHKPIGSLCVGPNGTVIMEGCCRTAADWELARNSETFQYSCVNLMLAGCDDMRVTDLMDPALVKAMIVPVSYDVQHPNKVSGHFSLGYFSYVPTFRMMVNFANVMIPAIDGYNGLKATLGDTTEGNSNAKLALDLALRIHLSCAYPEHDWSDFSYSPQGTRVADEGNAGIQGQRSNDGDKDVQEATCELHFGQQIQRMSKEFKSTEVFAAFRRLAMGMVNESVVEVFWGLYAECQIMLQDLRNEDAAVAVCCRFLKWHFSNKERRERLVKAFKPMNASRSSMAEVGHAQQQKLGRKGINLTKAVLVDTAHMQRQSNDIYELMVNKNVVRRKRGPDEYRDTSTKIFRDRQYATKGVGILGSRST